MDRAEQEKTRDTAKMPLIGKHHQIRDRKQSSKRMIVNVLLDHNNPWIVAPRNSSPAQNLLDLLRNTPPKQQNPIKFPVDRERLDQLSRPLAIAGATR